MSALISNLLNRNHMEKEFDNTTWSTELGQRLTEAAGSTRLKDIFRKDDIVKAFLPKVEPPADAEDSVEGQQAAEDEDEAIEAVEDEDETIEGVVDHDFMLRA